MSAIDTYRHTCLGFIECPSSYDFVFASKTRHIAIYELLDNIPNNEKDFDGRIGDILVGGGSGEAPALRISNPIAFQFFIYDDDTLADLEFADLEAVFKPFWTPTQAFIYGEGFLKLGWTVNSPLERWLTDNICKLLIAANDKFAIHRSNHADLTTNLTLINKA